MGLPGAGKTTLAQQMIEKLTSIGNTVTWFNADNVRTQYNDWDFSHKGRLNQSIRMAKLANESTTDYVICDFVAPLQEMRDNFQADCTIWVDTIDKSEYNDTNNLFEKPNKYDFKVTEKNADKWSKLICTCIRALAKYNKL